jgi:hypothetical protein
MAKSIPVKPEAIRVLIRVFSDIGLDELILWPCVPDLEQVDRFPI